MLHGIDGEWRRDGHDELEGRRLRLTPLGMIYGMQFRKWKSLAKMVICLWG